MQLLCQVLIQKCGLFLLLHGFPGLPHMEIESAIIICVCLHKKTNTKDKYPTVSFTTVRVTRQSCREFINSMRELVASGQPFHQIMTLRDPSSVTISDRYVLVELSNWADTPITVAIDVTNLYVMGYRSTNQSYFFPDAPPTSTLLTEMTHNPLPFGSAYPALEHEAGDRSRIYLGMIELEESIQDLYNYRRGNLARSFIVVIQMISEAVRFRYLSINWETSEYF